jgi:hypothetical protein
VLHRGRQMGRMILYAQKYILEVKEQETTSIK